VHRATSKPSRPSCRKTFRTRKTRRVISTRNYHLSARPTQPLMVEDQPHSAFAPFRENLLAALLTILRLHKLQPPVSLARFGSKENHWDGGNSGRRRPSGYLPKDWRAVGTGLSRRTVIPLQTFSVPSDLESVETVKGFYPSIEPLIVRYFRKT